ncbi:MAG: glycosyltransferase family 39 protein, partial [Lentisphaerota bacterium]
MSELGQWLKLHYRWLLLALLMMGLALRILLFIFVPYPYGYAYDPYYKGILVFYNEGHIPRVGDCWECYHPPLFYALSLPFYALGMNLSHHIDTALRCALLLPMACGLWIVWYGYRLFTLFRRSRGNRVLGLALLLAFPCLFISSAGLDVDILLTTILVTLIYYLVLYFHRPDERPWSRPILLGILCGLAIATKFTGMMGLLVA